MLPQADQTADEAKLQSLISKLDALLKGQNSLKKSLRLIDSILALAPGDQDVLKCKVVVLVQHENFEEALEAIAAASGFAAELAFEKAYCLYRLGQLEQALTAVQQVPDERRKARLHLEAQLQYRLGNNKQAIKVYSELFKVHKVESLELRTNVIAAYVCGGRGDEVPAVAKAMQISAADSSDVGFNMACALLQLGSFEEAEQQLQLAHRAGREALLEEDLPEEVADEELAPLTAQLAFVHDRLGQRADADAALQALGAMEALDSSTAAVVQNNSIAAAFTVAAPGPTLRKNAAELLKRLETLVERTSGGAGSAQLVSHLESRLMDSQKQAILSNRALLMLAAQKPDAAAAAFAGLRSRYPAYERLPLLQAALLAQAGKAKEADAELQSASGELSLQAVLMRVQLLLAAGNVPDALQLLQSLPEESLRFQPAVVATAVKLQEQQGDQAAAIQSLRTALDWWRNNMADASTGGEHPEAWLLQQLLGACIANGDTAEAKRLYQELASLKASPAVRAEALSALAMAHGTWHESGIEALAAGLPAPPEVDAATVSRLENSAAAATVKRSPKPEAAAAPESSTPQAAAAADAAATAVQVERTKKKKKRKPRYPKGFDPANPGPKPDPERWLPKWQRSGFKKPRKKRNVKEATGKGSQGQGRVDESLDISAKAAPEAPSVQAPAGKAAVKSAGGGRRKGRR